MSGGHFNYQQQNICDVADTLNRTIRDNAVADGHGYVNNYTAATLERFRLCASTLERAAKMLTRVDWLLSGDDGEDTFSERWDKENLWA